MSTLIAKELPDFNQLWDFSNPAKTETKFRELLPEAQKLDDKNYYFQLLTQIARTQGLQRKFDEAHLTLDQVKSRLESASELTEIRYLLERGRVFNSSKKATEALPFFVKAYHKAFKGNSDDLAVDAAHMVAIAEAKPSDQLEWNLKALAIAEKSEDDKARSWLGSLYNNIGWTYHDSGKLDEALSLFQRALAFRESKGEASSIRIAKWSVARTYRSLKRLLEALTIQLDLEREFAKEGASDGYVFEELAELYLLMAKNELAQKYFALAYKEFSKDEWFKTHESVRLKRIEELAQGPLSH